MEISAFLFPFSENFLCACDAGHKDRSVYQVAMEGKMAKKNLVTAWDARVVNYMGNELDQIRLNSPDRQVVCRIDLQHGLSKCPYITPG